MRGGEDCMYYKKPLTKQQRDILEEVSDQIAKEHGYKDYVDFYQNAPWDIVKPQLAVIRKAVLAHEV